MTHDDPERPLAPGGRPAWAEAPGLVLPLLQLTAQGEGVYLVQFMFPSQLGANAFSWVGKQFEVGPELNSFLLDWYTSPEETVRTHFQMEPPRGRVWNFPKRAEIDGEPIDTTQLKPEDLGL